MTLDPVTKILSRTTVIYTVSDAFKSDVKQDQVIGRSVDRSVLHCGSGNSVISGIPAVGRLTFQKEVPIISNACATVTLPTEGERERKNE